MMIHEYNYRLYNMEQSYIRCELMFEDVSCNMKCEVNGLDESGGVAEPSAAEVVSALMTQTQRS